MRCRRMRLCCRYLLFGSGFWLRCLYAEQVTLSFSPFILVSFIPHLHVFHSRDPCFHRFRFLSPYTSHLIYFHLSHFSYDSLLSIVPCICYRLKKVKFVCIILSVYSLSVICHLFVSVSVSVTFSSHSQFSFLYTSVIYPLRSYVCMLSIHLCRSSFSSFLYHLPVD
jgi:hypothetical protein